KTTMDDKTPIDAPVEADAGDQPAAADPGAELQRERDEYYDRWVRTTAEFDNYRKRVERERREQADGKVVDLLQDLLLVVDDFDRALTVASNDTAGAYKKGVELIHAKLHEFLKKKGVRPIEALGEDFDPDLHQAVIHESSPNHREGEVIGELQK